MRRVVKWDKVGGGVRVGNSYLRNAISMWRGINVQGYGRKTRRHKIERERKKRKIPAGTWSHQGASPEGKEIKKKVIDIHNSTHVIQFLHLEHGEEKDNESGQLGADGGENVREGDLIPQIGWHTGQNCRRRETWKNWGFEAARRRWEVYGKSSVDLGKARSCRQNKRK